MATTSGREALEGEDASAGVEMDDEEALGDELEPVASSVDTNGMDRAV